MTSLALALRTNAVRSLSPIQRAINILKSAGPGAWYDPSDLTTLFQDSAGTTPVTAVEQPVGLILDKSSTAAPVATIVDPSFDNAARWSPDAGWAVTGGNAVATAAASNVNMSPSGTGYTATVSGAAYKATVDVTSITSGSISLIIWNGSSNVAYTAILTAPGTYQLIYTANNTRCRPYLTTNAANTTLVVASLTQVSVPGAHLIQPTATSRPTLSSRYNLLTKTEQFDDAVWGKGGVTVTANAAIAPDGTTTADLIQLSAGTSAKYVEQYVASAGVMAFSVCVKAGTQSIIQILNGEAVTNFANFDLTAGTVGNTGATVTASIANIGGGWYRCSVSFTGVQVSSNYRIAGLDLSSNGYNVWPSSTGNFYVWGASLTTTADASLPYQRVNTATDYDYDFSKFPPFLRFDGVDDSMYSAASIDFTSTDKLCVFAGVHKANTSPGIVVEASALSDTSDGSFSYAVGGWADTREYFSTRGTVNRYPTFTVAPPATSVLSAASDISGDLITVRANGVQVINSPGDLGTGNFGNYPLYIGRRNNAGSPFNGRLYQLAIKGKALSAGEVSTVESFVNSKTKAY